MCEQFESFDEFDLDQVTLRAKRMSYSGEFVYEVPNFDAYISDSRFSRMNSKQFSLNWIKGQFEISMIRGNVSVTFHFEPIHQGCTEMRWDSRFIASIAEDKENLFSASASWDRLHYPTPPSPYCRHTDKICINTVDFSKTQFLAAAKAVRKNSSGSTLRIVLQCHAVGYGQLDPKYDKKPKLPSEIIGIPELPEALRRGAEADFTISCGGHEYPVQRAVMKWASPVFSGMLESGMEETLTNRVVIEDVAPETLEMVLDFIYKGRIDGVSSSHIIDLLYCAEKYQLLALKSHCLAYLVTTMSDDNVTQFLSSAIKYNAGEHTIEKLVDYCKKRCWKLLQHKEFRAYADANPEVFAESQKTERK